MKTLHVYASLTVLTAALVACSSDETVVPADTEQEVCFTTTVDAATSRAGNVVLDSLAADGFWVKSIKADGISYPWGVTGTLKFTSTDNGANFNAVVPAGSTFTSYWPTGQLLYFFATNIDPTYQTMSVNFPPIYTSYELNPDVTKQKDFVYATNMGTRADFTANNGKVPLNFKHALCQVEIKAKNTNPGYTVKVKGYQINYPCKTAKFTFPNPTSTDGLGSWAVVTSAMEGSEETPCYSGFYNGIATTENCIHDNTTNGFITLDAEERTISNGTDSGLALLIPGLKYSGYNITGNKGLNKGCYIALLVQIDHVDGTPIYPACQKGSLSKRISYSGLPRYYGYVYVAMDMNFNPSLSGGIEVRGKKLTYLLDFSNGLGKVDCKKPALVDPTASDYNAADGTGTALDSALDPYSAEATVLGLGMTVNLTVGDWTPETPDRNTPVQ